jgi:hypothetical protein
MYKQLITYSFGTVSSFIIGMKKTLFLSVVMCLMLNITAVHSTVFDSSLVSDIPTEETEALVSLFNATGGQDWNTNVNWLTPSPAGNWYGVQVGSGNVEEIALSTNLLDGVVPSSIGSLSSLKVLDFSNNLNLTGYLPNEITYLSLQVLYIDQTNLLIPDTGLFRDWLGGIDMVRLPEREVQDVSEPSSFFMLCLGGFFLLRRRFSPS